MSELIDNRPKDGSCLVDGCEETATHVGTLTVTTKLHTSVVALAYCIEHTESVQDIKGQVYTYDLNPIDNTPEEWDE